jgi:hypothetical protein
MDHGTDRGDGAPGGHEAGTIAVTDQAAPGRVPLAVAVVDREGLISHWSSGARRLFGAAEEAALGRPATDLLPVTGALAPDAAPASRHPAAGRARLTVPTGDRVAVLWWAYPLAGPGPERLLVLAVDAAVPRPPEGGEHAPAGEHGDVLAAERVAPGFTPRTDVPAALELARRLPACLPGMSIADSAWIVAQALELGYPVLEFGGPDRVPVVPA